MSRLELDFEHAGRGGRVSVDLGVISDPAALGCPPFARGFPWCRATIEPAARGYQDALGWIQLVDSSVASDGFVGFTIDPFAPLGEVSHPFCFYGFAPTHFDAPHRDDRPDMDWRACSFLGGVSGDHQAFALLGFSWGYSIRDGAIEIVPLAPLTEGAWGSCLPSLHASHPQWTFLPGFAPRASLTALDPAQLDQPG